MLNQVVLMGRLVADPELRTTTTGRSVCSFRIAVNRNQKPGADGQVPTDFISCVAWEYTGQFVSRYFQKGSMIAVVGSLQSRSYEDKTGSKRNVVEVNVREANFCGSKAESGTSGYSQTNAATVQAPAYQTANSADFEEITDDEDLPF